MKPYTTIQLNVKVTEDTADQIRKLAITHDITVAEQLEESLRKFEIAQRKSGKVSASGYFLLIKMMMYLTNQISVEDFVHMVEESGKLGVEYMKQSNSSINDVLTDGASACHIANQ